MHEVGREGREGEGRGEGGQRWMESHGIVLEICGDLKDLLRRRVDLDRPLHPFPHLHQTPIHVVLGPLSCLVWLQGRW